MERRTLLLCDFEEDYAARLSAFIKRDRIFSWQITIMTGKEEVSEFKRWQEFDLILMSEAAYEVWKDRLLSMPLIILSESGLCRWKNVHYVDKYCPADDVYRRIMEIYTHMRDDILERVTMDERTKLIGFYSPDGGSIQTEFALTYGQLLSQKNKVLYVSLAPFQSYSELMNSERREDLMTLLYYLESERFGVTLQNAIFKIGNMHTISAKSGHNLVYITKDQWQLFLSEMLRCGVYDYVLLDLKDSVQGLPDLLTRCSRIYTLTSDNHVAQQKLMLYKELLSQLSAENILQKTNFLCVPYFRKLPHSACELTGSELADYVRMIFRKESG